MKTKKHFLLLLIGISFFSCNSAVKNSAVPMSNVDEDFPVTEKLEFKPFNKYDIVTDGLCMIDDSVLWYFDWEGNDLGACYNLNTGKKLSVIASRGRAANELINLETFRMIGDSVLLYSKKNTIKAFAKKDITDNIPMGERKFTVTTAPDSILFSQVTKLPNGASLATIRPAIFESELENKNEINKKSIVVFNDKEAKSFEVIKYDDFDVENAKDKELATNDLIKYAYANGAIEIKDNNTAVFSVDNQFILYTFDINNGKIVNEKKYTNIQRTKQKDKSFVSYITTNDRSMQIHLMKHNDKKILCLVRGYLSEEDKEAKLYKEAIFVFDWELNPIKKFDLPKREKGYYSIANDCKSVYFCEYYEDGLALYKADLDI